MPAKPFATVEEVREIIRNQPERTYEEVLAKADRIRAMHLEEMARKSPPAKSSVAGSRSGDDKTAGR